MGAFRARRRGSDEKPAAASGSEGKAEVEEGEEASEQRKNQMMGAPYTKEYLALGAPNKDGCFASISAALEQSDLVYAPYLEVENSDQKSASLAASKEGQYSKNP